MIKCQLCKKNEADIAMQYIGDDIPTFTRLGSHYRGFKVTKVCFECKESVEYDMAQSAPDDHDSSFYHAASLEAQTA